MAIFSLFLALPSLTLASTSVIMNKNEASEKIKTAKNCFHREVNTQKVTELKSVIDEINISFDSVKEILLVVMIYLHIPSDDLIVHQV